MNPIKDFYFQLKTAEHFPWISYEIPKIPGYSWNCSDTYKPQVSQYSSYRNNGTFQRVVQLSFREQGMKLKMDVTETFDTGFI